MDLFTPVVPESDWHPNFAVMVKHPNAWNAAVLNGWAAGFVDRDRKFVRQFQTTFNDCFWELYLHAVLRERGLSINFASASPDFTVSSPVPFTIEATIASHAKDDLPEHRRAEAELPPDLNEFNRQTILRLANALGRKHKEFSTKYAALPHVAGKPFVIAVAAFDRPYFSMTCQRAIEAVLFNYYVDEESYVSAGDPNSPIPKYSLESIIKHNGSTVTLGLFQNGAMPEVSAVIFSSCATLGKVRALSADPNPKIFFDALRRNPTSTQPHRIQACKSDYKESLLDGLRVYHNPDALHPLDLAMLRDPDVFQTYFCAATGKWIYEDREGQLLFRAVRTEQQRVPASDAIEEVVSAAPAANPRQAPRRQ